MNRRGFLGRLFAGTAAIAVAPTLLSEPFMKPSPVVATISEWNEYCNFSSFVTTGATDEVIEQSAVELGYRASQSIEELYRATFDA